MMALSLAGLTGFPVQAKEYFNPAFLDNGSGAPVDLSSYESAGVVPEGDYLVDVYMNQMQAFTRSMHFVKNDKGEVLPEVTPAQLKSAGVAIDRLDGLKGLAPDAVIKDLRAAVPGVRKVRLGTDVRTMAYEGVGLRARDSASNGRSR